MIHRLILTLVLNIFIFSLFSQSNNKFVIVKTIDKGDYSFIPKTALNDSVSAVLYQDKISLKVNPKYRPITLYWNSSCTDGNYNLTITPEQIYFHSGHNNPNPNELIWVYNLRNNQYREIRDGFIKNPPSIFVDNSSYYEGSKYVYFESTFKDSFGIPNEWTDSTMKLFDENCIIQVNKQTKKYLTLINEYINNQNMKIGLVDSLEFIKMKPKYFYDQEYLIMEYMTEPQLIEMLKDTDK